MEFRSGMNVARDAANNLHYVSGLCPVAIESVLVYGGEETVQRGDFRQLAWRNLLDIHALYNVPRALGTKVKVQARRHYRSLDDEILVCFEKDVRHSPLPVNPLHQMREGH